MTELSLILGGLLAVIAIYMFNRLIVSRPFRWIRSLANEQALVLWATFAAVVLRFIYPSLQQDWYVSDDDIRRLLIEESAIILIGASLAAALHARSRTAKSDTDGVTAALSPFTVFLGSLPARITVDHIKSWLRSEGITFREVGMIVVGNGTESKRLAIIGAVDQTNSARIVRRFHNAALDGERIRAYCTPDPRITTAEAAQLKGELHHAFQSANAGDPAAQFWIGCMYSVGQHMPRDDQEAVKWWRLAASQGHKGAQYNLGLAYLKGEGIEADEAEATKWFSLASRSGL